MPILPQRFTHRGADVCFRHGIEVAIDIRRGVHIAMSEPFPDLLHWHALGKEHRGAGMAHIVEAYLLQLMLLQQLSEVLGDKIGIIELTGSHSFLLTFRWVMMYNYNIFVAIFS